MDKKLFNQLDEDQRQAVEASPSKALKIIAGPGTGKTHTMIKRFMALSKVCPANQILALTFTNKAAEEMLLRLEAEGLQRHNLWVSTFHSFATRLLREFPFNAGLDAGFRIIEENEQELLLRRCLSKLKVENRELIEAIEALQPDLIDKLWHELPAIVKRIKLHLLQPADFPRALKLLDRKTLRQVKLQDKEKKLEESIISLVEAYYRIYQAKLEENNVLDFSDLLLKLYNLLQDKSYRERCRRRFQYILVDEFQDTNIAQFKILDLLARPGMSNVSVVGDGKQSIYGFRDADMANLTRRFPPAEEVLLRVNYRSFQPILDFSGQLISRNYPRPIEELKAHLGKGTTISIGLFVAENEEEEAEFIARKIRQLLGGPLRSRNKILGRKEGDPINFGDFAVLMRAMRGRKKVQLIEQALNRWQIPYRIIGGAAFLGSQEAIDILNYLKIVENPLDDISMVAVLNNPGLRISDYQLCLLKESRFNNFSFYDNSLYSCLLATKELGSIFPPEVLDRLKEFRLFLDRMISLRDRVSLASLVSSVIEESGYLRYIKGGTAYRSQLGLANLQRLHRLAKEFDDRQVFCSLNDFVDYIDMIKQLGLDERDIEVAPTEEAVSLMTIHKAKGLEFPIVFMTDFPPKRQMRRKYRNLYFDEDFGLVVKGRKGEEHSRFQRFIKDKHPNQKDLEEEERVKYVGLTRAQELLILTAIESDNPDLSWLKEFCMRNHPLAKELQMSEKLPQEEGVRDDKKPLENGERELILKRLDKLVGLELSTPYPPLLPSQLRLSYSQLVVYMHCPLQYYFMYVLGIPRPDEQLEGGIIPFQENRYGDLNIKGLSWGILVHKALSQFHRTPPLPAFEERLQRLKEIFRLLLSDEGRERRFSTKIDRILEKYASHPYSEIEPAYIDREFNLKLELQEGARINLRGFIDRIDRCDTGWKIIDYKTDAKITEHKMESWQFQLLTYLLALRRGALQPEIKPEDKFEIEILQMQKGKIISFSSTEYELHSAEKKITHIAEKIASSQFNLTEEHKERDCRSCYFGGDFGFCPHNRYKSEAENKLFKEK